MFEYRAVRRDFYGVKVPVAETKDGKFYPQIELDKAFGKKGFFCIGREMKKDPAFPGKDLNVKIGRQKVDGKKCMGQLGAEIVILRAKHGANKKIRRAQKLILAKEKPEHVQPDLIPASAYDIKEAADSFKVLDSVVQNTTRLKDAIVELEKINFNLLTKIAELEGKKVVSEPSNLRVIVRNKIVSRGMIISERTGEPKEKVLSRLFCELYKMFEHVSKVNPTNVKDKLGVASELEAIENMGMLELANMCADTVLRSNPIPELTDA